MRILETLNHALVLTGNLFIVYAKLEPPSFTPAGIQMAVCRQYHLATTDVCGGAASVAAAGLLQTVAPRAVDGR